jgi:pyrimidine-nucleoside phosphorylase
LKEALETLQGGGPADFREHCLVVAGHMLALGGVAAEEQAGQEMAAAALASGAGWEKFRRLVRSQGGDVTVVDRPEKLPAARHVTPVIAPQTGYLSRIDARVVGETAVELGAGRAKKGDAIDYAVGITIHHKVGDRVERGSPLFTLHANDPSLIQPASQRLLQAHAWSSQPVEPLPLFYGVIRQPG